VRQIGIVEDNRRHKEGIMAEHDDLGAAERSSDEIRDDIAAQRESISQTVGLLGERIHETLDWKAYVARYPYVAVGVAVGAGLILSGLFKRKASPTERIVDALIDKAEELGDDLRRSARRLIIKHAAPGLFRGTLYGLAGRALMQYLHNRAIHAEGNGANLSSETEWRDPRRTTSMPTMS
jgi:ElaB/YqjD/DUF883 family membrane-anchored ribosome-binding protein